MANGTRRPFALPLVCLSIVAMAGTTMAADTFVPVMGDYLIVEDEVPLSLSDSESPLEIIMADPTGKLPLSLVEDTYYPAPTEGFDGSTPQLNDAGQEFLVPAAVSQSSSDRRDWVLLPDGLLWHSYLAGPQEPRISALLFGNDKGGYFSDATLGGRVGFLRYGTPGAHDPRGWQWDLEGAVITRMDLEKQEDIESMDYRFGTELTWAEGPWAMKAGYFHISSHVGDEYLLRSPTFDRINYVTESLIWGASYKPSQPVRVYGEMAYAVHRSGGARPFQFQTGAEWTPPPKRARRLAPFAAANLGFFEATEFHMQTTLQAGWYFQGPQSDRRLRFGLQYGDGPTSQFEFFKRSEEYLGVGIWYDY